MARTHDITISGFDLDRIEADNARLRGELDAAKTEITGLSQIASIYEKENQKLRNVANRLKKIASAYLGWYAGDMPIEAFREISGAVIDANDILSNDQITNPSPK